MTEISFEDAVTELIGRFVVASPHEKELAARRLNRLTVVADRASMRSEYLPDEDDRFDNMPV